MIIFISYNSPSQLRITEPVGNDTLLTMDQVRIQWTGASEYNISLFYSEDHGNRWKLIESEITDDYHDWTVPVLDTLNIQFRIINKTYIPPALNTVIENAHSAEINTAELFRDGSLLLSASNDKTVKLWELPSKILLDSIYIDGLINDADYYTSSDSILVCADSNVYLWDRINDTVINQNYTGFAATVRELDVHPFRRLYAAASLDGHARIFDLASGTKIREFSFSDTSRLSYLKFSKDGTQLLITGYNGEMLLYDWENGQIISHLDGHGGNGGGELIWECDVNPYEALICSGGVDNTVRIWDYNSEQQLKLIDEHTFFIRAVEFHPKGHMILSASLDSTIRQWDSFNGEDMGFTLHHGAQVVTASYSISGDTIISAGRFDGTVKLWHNFSIMYEQDTSKAVVRHPAYVRAEDLTIQPGESAFLPLKIYKNAAVPNVLPQINQAKVLMATPMDYLYIRTGAELRKQVCCTDTFNFTLENITFDTTYRKVIATGLFGGFEDKEIELLSFTVENDTAYKFFLENGNLNLLELCPGDSSKYLSFTSSGNKLSLMPNPAQSKINLDFYVIEDNIYSINLFDEAGSFVETIFHGELSSGRYTQVFHISNNISSGAYFAVLKSDRVYVTKKIFIIP